MKVIYLPAEIEADVLPVVAKSLKYLDKKVGILTTAQHLSRLKDVQKFLLKEGFKAEIGGQVLGCNQTNVKKIEAKVDCFLYIGSGRFHPIGIGLKTKKKVVCANPLNEEVSVLDRTFVDVYEKKKQGAMLKFYDASNVGVLITTKSGQNRYKLALKLEKKYPDKKFYFFVCETLMFNELENFPFIDCWVNTMCLRIMDDREKFAKPVVNMDDVL